jgi:hypothetical protein
MNPIDIDALLARNPKLDAEAVKQQQKKSSDRERQPKEIVSRPFGKRPDRGGNIIWKPDNTSRKSYYRAVF